MSKTNNERLEVIEELVRKIADRLAPPDEEVVAEPDPPCPFPIGATVTLANYNSSRYTVTGWEERNGWGWVITTYDGLTEGWGPPSDYRLVRVFKVGDWVRVNYPESRHHDDCGFVTKVVGKPFGCNVKFDSDDEQLFYSASSLIVVPMPEPAHHKVVTDRDGIAWQRDNTVWYSAGGSSPRQWVELVKARGPITVMEALKW